MAEAGGEDMVVEIVVGNIMNRSLYIDDRRKWGFFAKYSASINHFPYKLQLHRSKLVSETRDLAIDASLELFKRFGWNVDRVQLNEWLHELLKK